MADVPAIDRSPSTIAHSDNSESNEQVDMSQRTLLSLILGDGATGRYSDWDTELSSPSSISDSDVQDRRSTSRDSERRSLHSIPDVQARSGMDSRPCSPHSMAYSLDTAHELVRAARTPAGGAAARNRRLALSESPPYQRFAEEAARERIPTLTNTSSSAPAARTSVLPPSFIGHSPAAAVVGLRGNSTSQIPYSSPWPTSARTARVSSADLRRQTSNSIARSGRAVGPSFEVSPILARAAELVQQEREAQERFEADQHRSLVEQWRAQQEQLLTQAGDSNVNNRRSSAYEPVSSQSRPSRSTSTSIPARPRATPQNRRQAATDANPSERGREGAGWQRVWQHTAGIVAQKKLVEDEFQQKWLGIAKREAEAALNPSSNTEDFQAERARLKADFDQRRTSSWPVNDVHLQESVVAEEQADLERAVQFRLAQQQEQARRRQEAALQREQDRRRQEENHSSVRYRPSSSPGPTGLVDAGDSSVPGMSITSASPAAPRDLQSAWTAYEKAWAGLSHKAANARLRWTDIPWPMLVQPARAEGLVGASIAAFILSPAHSKDRSLKDRLRYALIRWHPARFEGHWLPKCAEGQREEIKNGALLVVRVLRGLLPPEPSRDSPLPQPSSGEQQQNPTMAAGGATAEDDIRAGGVSSRWTLPRDNCLERGSTITMTSFRQNQRVPIIVFSAAPIASGTSAYVYQGIKPGIVQRIVALKVFPSIMRDTERELLCRELINVSQMAIGPGCKRILPFLGTAMHGGRMILVSEFMSNGNVLDFLARFPAAPRQRLTLQVAEGVTFLHTTARLVHGDLKCENVLVSSGGTAVIADFGLSTTIDKLDNATATAIRHWNTLAFAAPELHLDEATNLPEEHRPRSKTPKSDVYAFGMLVLQTFTGKRPWHGLSGQTILRKVCNGEKPERPGREITVLGLTDAWWGVCMKCWETSPLDRPSIDTVLAALEATSL